MRWYQKRYSLLAKKRQTRPVDACAQRRNSLNTDRRIRTGVKEHHHE
jgi:hypothetical protein